MDNPNLVDVYLLNFMKIVKSPFRRPECIYTTTAGFKVLKWILMILLSVVTTN